jgi:hypothetical protein
LCAVHDVKGLVCESLTDLATTHIETCNDYTKLKYNSVDCSCSQYVLCCRVSETLNSAVSPFFLEQLAIDVFILCMMGLHITVVSLYVTL